MRGKLRMANDVAAAILQELPRSSVWLVVYRDYNHEEGIAVRKRNNGFGFRHFGGDRHNVNVSLVTATEIYCMTLKDAVAQLWALANVLSRPRGLELVYVPDGRISATIAQTSTVWRVGTATMETQEAFAAQMTPLLDTLESVRML